MYLRGKSPGKNSLSLFRSNVAELQLFWRDRQDGRLPGGGPYVNKENKVGLALCEDTKYYNTTRWQGPPTPGTIIAKQIWTICSRYLVLVLSPLALGLWRTLMPEFPIVSRLKSIGPSLWCSLFDVLQLCHHIVPSRSRCSYSTSAKQSTYESFHHWHWDPGLL